MTISSHNWSMFTCTLKSTVIKRTHKQACGGPHTSNPKAQCHPVCVQVLKL